MGGIKEKCGYCGQLVKTNNATWNEDYDTVHKSCLKSIKEKNMSKL